MIASAVITNGSNGNRESLQALMTLCGIEKSAPYDNRYSVLSSSQIIDTLEERGVRNVDIARTLGLTETRASEIRKGKRRLLYDEGATLVERFKLSEQRPNVLTRQVAELMVRHIANTLGTDASDTQVTELSKDLLALAALVSDHRGQQATHLLEQTLQLLHLRQQVPTEDRPL